MRFQPSFYRAAALCSAVSAVTTLLLIFMPEFYEPVTGFDGRMQRVHDPSYQLRAWAYLVHPFITFAAALAVAMRVRVTATASAVIGIAGFALWAATEAGQQTLTLFAFDEWRRVYATADELTRAQIRTNVAVYDGLWNAAYFLLLLGFAVGNLVLGIALARLRGFTRLIGWLLLAAFGLTFIYIAGELKWFTLPESFLDSWVYPAIQPVARLLIGVWLWRAADERGPLPGMAKNSP